MKKIPSLFQRNYEGDRLVWVEVVEGSEWVLAGEGMATRKWDGTACMIRDAVLYKRYDRKQKRGKLKDPPAGWEPCEPEPNEDTGHWPGWVPVGDGPEDQWHREAWDDSRHPINRSDGTFELCGPKIQGNPERYDTHVLVRHGSERLIGNPRTFHEIRVYLGWADIEGIVWHHGDGRMVKIKARDFAVGRGAR